MHKIKKLTIVILSCLSLTLYGFRGEIENSNTKEYVSMTESNSIIINYSEEEDPGAAH
ncbi:hypothetical protein V1502_18710 [Bacillus sp. SCS-153A]|uniref:hypothetical protein n=1 Tax=Rossellomorea sedimentorum TaxID=3115294 RepID=UPI0039065C24